MMRCNPARYLHRVSSRNRDHLSQRPLETGYPVLFIFCTLVRITRRAVLAQHRLIAARAADSLVYKNTIANGKVTDIAAHLNDLPTEFVSKDLGCNLERHRLAALISVIVCMPPVNVKIGPAQTHRVCSHKNIAGPGSRRFDVADLELLTVI